MADATTLISIQRDAVKTACSFWGRLTRKDARALAIKHYKAELLRVQTALGVLESGGGRISWWNGTKELADPELNRGHK